MKTKHLLLTLAATAALVGGYQIIAQERPAGPPGERGERGPGGPGGMRPNPLLNALDANHDGVIDAAEIANAPAALKTLDKNNDGKLTMEELRPAPGGPRGGGPGEGRPERPGQPR